MKVWYSFSLFLAAFVCFNPAMSVSGTLVDWADLPDPSVQGFEDPFRDLSPEQFDDVLFVVRLRGRLRQQVGSDEERQKWQELLSETEDALLAVGVNVDWLLDQREVVAERRRKAGAMGNPQFDGQTITLTGFVVPAPSDPDGQPVAYLVPERGMCSHVPPPPPNQMIRVRLKKDWTPNYVHQPVRLTGKMTIDATEQDIVVIDGIVPMRATFQLDAYSVEALGSENDFLEWSRSIADHVLAAGNRKTGGAKSSEQ